MKTWTPEQEQFLIDNCMDMNYRDIGEKIGKSRFAVCKKAYALKVGPGRGRRLGEKNKATAISTEPKPKEVKTRKFFTPEVRAMLYAEDHWI